MHPCCAKATRRTIVTRKGEARRGAGVVAQRVSTLTFLLILLATTWFAVANPATCACGAHLPHPHPWFEVPGHHHNHGSTGVRAPFSRADIPDGPTLTLPTPPVPVGTAVPVVVLIAFHLILLLTCQRIREMARRPPYGRSVLPPVPPPRIGTVCRLGARLAHGV